MSDWVEFVYSPAVRRFILVFSIGQTRSFRTSGKLDKKDYYDVLGLPKTATAKDVKKAYYTVCFFSIIISVDIRFRFS